MKLLESGQGPPEKDALASLSAATKDLVSRWQRLRLKEGVLYYIDETGTGQERHRLVLPYSLRSDVLHALHNLRVSGHLGITRTTERVKQRFYWPGLAIDVARWCTACAICASRKGKAPPKRVPMQSRPVGVPFERLALDVLDTRKATRKGNLYLLVVYDYFSKWMDAYPLKRHTAMSVAEVLVKRIVCYHGIPARIHSDQGREFESELFSHMLKMLNIGKSRTAPYRAQSNGAVERANRTLLNMLSAFVNIRADDWDEHIPFLAMAYRSSVHSSTGCTPYAMLHGREVTLPVDLMYPSSADLKDAPGCHPEYVEWVKRAIQAAHSFAREHLGKAAVRQKRGYDARAKERDALPIGSLVRYYYPPLMQTSKFARPWEGPYKVLEKTTEVDYRIQSVANPTKVKVVHFDTLKPFEGSDEGAEIPDVVEFIDGGEEYDFESLWDHAVTEFRSAPEITLPPTDGATGEITEKSSSGLDPPLLEERECKKAIAQRPKRTRHPPKWFIPG